MKTIITSQQETIKVTKKVIKKILELERAVSFYSHLNSNTMAYAIGMAQHEYLTDVSKLEAIDDIYDEIEEIIESYLAHNKHLEDSTI